MKKENSINKIIQIKDIDIGKNIKQIRKDKNIKQNEMIIKLQLYGIEISIYTLNRIENGKQNPTVSFLHAICEILNCDMNEIFNFSKSKF